MPKEYVFGPDGDVCGFRVRVGWTRREGGGWVQLATIDPRGEETMPASGDSREYGLYVTLEREEINDLIRLLRRARDQAYGRDE